MEALTVDTLPPVAADHDPVRCLLAIELSKKSWIVAINTPLADKISRHTVHENNWKELLKLMQRIRTHVARAVGRPVEMIAYYEAGYDGFWLHRLLEGQGVHSLVIDPPATVTQAVENVHHAGREGPRRRRVSIRFSERIAEGAEDAAMGCGRSMSGSLVVIFQAGIDDAEQASCALTIGDCCI